ncbi:MAG: methionine--tRNA ligase [Patescibacteria group bacterium]|nr:methionine--tRNA ligase [Patescibacteria group bacterium]
MNKFYITTAIPYVNAKPHIGFALEIVQTDCLARYRRLKGDDTYFLTGTDEHGVKLYKTAKEEGIPPQKFADDNAEKFKALKDLLALSNDDFIRTTSDLHKRGAQKLWSKLVEKGDIYKDKYVGNYCVGCESYIANSDLVDGKCPNHDKAPEKLEEKNYFFKLSRYSDQIRKAIETDELLILPKSRKQEMLNIIGEGLPDISFSRPKKILPWGITVPGDDDQVMYVWCDALSNYITALGYADDDEKVSRYWPADVHVIGKDILRFHAGYWIGMLMSAGISIPKAIYVHGFITSEGKKMSKSLGNVVDPVEYVEKYGVDSLRYYLLREIPTCDDGDFSKTRFEAIYDGELANNVGNLFSRVCAMTEKYFDGKVPPATDGKDVVSEVATAHREYHENFEKFDLKAALEAVLRLADFANGYVEENRPWELAKKDTNKLADVMYNLLEMLAHISYMLQPFIPNAAEKMFAQLSLTEQNFPAEDKWGILKEGSEISKGEPLFPRLDS